MSSGEQGRLLVQLHHGVLVGRVRLWPYTPIVLLNTTPFAPGLDGGLEDVEGAGEVEVVKLPGRVVGQVDAVDGGGVDDVVHPPGRGLHILQPAHVPLDGLVLGP
jgi:hypothetical protein